MSLLSDKDASLYLTVFKLLWCNVFHSQFHFDYTLSPKRLHEVFFRLGTTLTTTKASYFYSYSHFDTTFPLRCLHSLRTIFLRSSREALWAISTEFGLVEFSSQPRLDTNEHKALPYVHFNDNRGTAPSLNLAPQPMNTSQSSRKTMTAVQLPSTEPILVTTWTSSRRTL